MRQMREMREMKEMRETKEMREMREIVHKTLSKYDSGDCSLLGVCKCRRIAALCHLLLQMCRYTQLGVGLWRE